MLKRNFYLAVIPPDVVPPAEVPPPDEQPDPDINPDPIKDPPYPPHDPVPPQPEEVPPPVRGGIVSASLALFATRGMAALLACPSPNVISIGRKAAQPANRSPVSIALSVGFSPFMGNNIRPRVQDLRARNWPRCLSCLRNAVAAGWE